MKYMNHVKSGLLAMAFACAGICFTGCEDDVVINTGNSDKLDTVDLSLIHISEPTRP